MKRRQNEPVAFCRRENKILKLGEDEEGEGRGEDSKEDHHYEIEEEEEEGDGGIRWSSKICGGACFALDEIKSLRQKSLRRKWGPGLLFANSQHKPTVEETLVMLFEDHGQMTLKQLKTANAVLDAGAGGDEARGERLSRYLFNCVVPCRITYSAKASSPCLFRYATFLKRGVNRTTRNDMERFLASVGNGKEPLKGTHDEEVMRMFGTDLTKDSWWCGAPSSTRPKTPLRDFHHGVAFTNLLVEMSLKEPDPDRLIAFASLLIYFWNQRDAPYVLNKALSSTYRVTKDLALRGLGVHATACLDERRGRTSYFTLLFGLLATNVGDSTHKAEIGEIVRLLSRGGAGMYYKMEKVLPLALMDVILRHRGVDLGTSALTREKPGSYYKPATCYMKMLPAEDVWERLDEEYDHNVLAKFGGKMPDWAVDKHTFRGRTNKKIPREWALKFCDDKAAFESLTEEEVEERLGEREKRGLNAFMGEGVAGFANVHPLNDPFFDKVEYLKGGTFGHEEWIGTPSFQGVLDHFAQKICNEQPGTPAVTCDTLSPPSHSRLNQWEGGVRGHQDTPGCIKGGGDIHPGTF